MTTDGDLSALFGLDMDTATPAVAADDDAPRARRKTGRAGVPAQAKPSGDACKGAARKSARPQAPAVTGAAVRRTAAGAARSGRRVRALAT